MKSIKKHSKTISIICTIDNIYIYKEYILTYINVEVASNLLDNVIHLNIYYMLYD